MRLSLLSVVACLFVANTSCAPMRIRKHEAVNLQGASRFFQITPRLYDHVGWYSIKSSAFSGSVDIGTTEAQQQTLKVTVALYGKKGTTAKVVSNKLKYRYVGGDWSITTGQLQSSQRSLPSGQPASDIHLRELHPEFNKEYAYSVGNEDGNREGITLSFQIPKEERNLEIEIPEIYIAHELLEPRVLQFRWNDDWIFVPLNGR